VRTDIAGFAGFTERGPLPPPGNPPRDFDWTTVAIKVESWKQFLATFGSFHACGYLAYSVRAFFETGGMTCYVVRVAATTAADPAMCPSTAQFPLPGAAAAAAGVLKTAAVGYALDHTGAPGIQLSPGSLIGIAGTGLLQIDSVVAIAADGDRSPLLARIKAPTQIIHGRQDPLVPVAAGLDLAARIGGAQIDVIDAMGHDLPIPLWPRFAAGIAAAAGRA